MAEFKKYNTPVFRLSFPELFVAKQFGDNPTAKFGCAAVWTPADFNSKEKALWRIITSAMNDASLDRFKKPLKELPSTYKRGIRDGDDKANLAGYGSGTKFANLTTKRRPGVLDRDLSKIGPEHGNADLIYPGCYCRATVTVYSFDNKGKGIALGLMNIQRVKDGERLDSYTDAAEDFEDDLEEAENGEDTEDFLD